MKKIIIDCRMRKAEKVLLNSLGYELIELEKSKDVYEEISSHPDIFGVKIKDKLVLEPNTYNSLVHKVLEEDILVIGNECVEATYPKDIKYNVCIVGKYAIHNYKYTDETIIKLLEEYGYERIDVSQGYANCSIAVIDDRSIITSDNGIYKKLKNLDLDILFIEPDNIKLLNNGVYSMKKGFVGGCLTRLKPERNGKNVIFVSGDLNKLNSGKKIRDFISDRNIDLIELPGLDVIDYGGMVEL